MKKGSKLYSILKEKCPVCQEGEVFFTKKKYDLKKFDKTLERCSNCNHKFEIEGGFWQGAMYVSYAVSVSYALIVFLLTFLIYPDMSAWGYIIIISSIVILVTPINFRISRMIWMNLFSSYNKEKTIGN